MGTNWHLNEHEAAELERRVLKQLYEDAKEIFAGNSNLPDRYLLLQLWSRGYTRQELERISEYEIRHAF